MSRSTLARGLAALVTIAAATTACSGSAQSAAGNGDTAARTSRATATSPDDRFLQWPVLPGNEAYATIDGRQLHKYVVHQAEIARRYRDQGHQFWGRVIGTSSDAESADWLLAKFKEIGLEDVRLQPLDLVPQWLPQSWEVTASGGAEPLKLATAQPAYFTPATASGGLDLEAVWVGTGTEADYASRKDSVKGKAVFMQTMPRPGGGESAGFRLAAAHGAAAIFAVNGLPGNLRSQLQTVDASVPSFTVGLADGTAVRNLIGKAQPGKAPRVKVHLDTKMVPNLKSATVWGKLTGTTDETIYVLAHRDGWFDGATDNASGVATLIGLAEHYAKLPQSARRRTIYFLGVNGHHNKTETDPRVQKEMQGVIDDRLAETEAFGSRSWLAANREKLFAKTALMINSEHTSTLQTYLKGASIRSTNAYTALQWFAGGSNRPQLRAISVSAFKEFGVPIYDEPESPAPPGGELGMFWRFLPGVTSSDYNMFFHTDAETAETVPWTGLEATTRAYAKIIDEVNKLQLSDLQRPHEPPTRRATQ